MILLMTEKIKTMTQKELKQIMEDYGFNQSSLAKLMGINQCTISRYVNNKHPIPQSFANHLALIVKYERGK